MKIIRKHQALRIRRRLKRLYGNQADSLMERYYALLGRYGIGLDMPGKAQRWDETDAYLISYADNLQQPGEAPLKTLHQFCSQRLRGLIKTVHLLPFYPWSSDDGFSVIDYRQVHEEYGEWRDVEAFGRDFHLMFDFVLNHGSAKSDWFRDFVTGIAPARFYFLPTDPKADLSAVVRPRAHPLLTKTTTREGEAWLWTTFSADQVDFNFQNPDLLFEFLDILFLYLAKGAKVLRLDAIAFLWKEIGTTCLHLPETHQVVKLFRDILDMVAPDVILLTETNVPHKENIAYFGRGDEAHMVYNFPLPPLLLHALLRGDGSHLTNWAHNLEPAPRGCTYLNFTASHDGVGVRPLQGLVPPEEISWLARQIEERGGQVNYRALPDGSKAPYELCATWFSALHDGDDELSLQRFLLSQTLMCTLQGIPALYIHTLFATSNWHEGHQQTQHHRTLNRRKYQLAEVEDILRNPDSLGAKAFTRLQTMLHRRATRRVFHPGSPQTVYDLGPEIFAVQRTAFDESETLLALFNLTAKPQNLKMADLPEDFNRQPLRDILRNVNVKSNGKLTLEPYQAMWLMTR